MQSYIIPAWEIDRWNNALTRCAPYDIYHMAQYHLLAQHKGVPYLLVVDPGIMAMPFLQSEDEALSVYGYPGPLFFQERGQTIENDYQHIFQNALLSCFNQLGIKRFETRLHPLIDTAWLLEGMCEIKQVGTTVAIDLQKLRSEQQAEISKGHKADIKKAWGLSIERDWAFKHIDVFIKAYQETMDRVEAKHQYYFSDAYFYGLRAFVSPHNMELWHAWDKDEIVSSAIFFNNDRFVQYHLSATPIEHIDKQGAKAILANLICLCRGAGYRWFHLGGGLGGDEDDPLFTFKKGFSKLRLPFCIARWEA